MDTAVKPVQTGRGRRRRWRGAGAEGLGGGCVKKSLRAQRTQITRGNIRWLTRVTGCSIVLACQVLDKPRSWFYDRRSSGLGWPVRRPEVEAAIGRLLGSSQASYGYRRIHALLTRQGLTCDLKTVWEAMRRRGWLSTSRTRLVRSGRRHQGQVRVTLAYLSGFQSLILLLALLSSGLAYAEWVWIASAKSDGGYDVYADRSTIRRKGDLVRIRVLYDYKTIQLSSGLQYLSNRTEWQSNCAAALQRRIEVIWFSDNMAEGDEVFSASVESKWSSVPPRSIAQSLFRVACRKT